MRAISRLSQVVRGFSSNVSKAASPSAPADPLKNVVGKLFNEYFEINSIFYKFLWYFLGLTSGCVKSNEAKNVPGTGKDYKSPEYFGYNRMSYHEAEVEMEKFRVPQPVAPRK